MIKITFMYTQEEYFCKNKKTAEKKVMELASHQVEKMFTLDSFNWIKNQLRSWNPELDEYRTIEVNAFSVKLESIVLI